MTTPQDLTDLTASDDASARRAAVKEFLRTGDYDPKFPDWSGNVIERETKATDDMLQALVAEVKKRSERSASVSIPRLTRRGSSVAQIGAKALVG